MVLKSKEGAVLGAESDNWKCNCTRDGLFYVVLRSLIVSFFSRKVWLHMDSKI